MENIQNINDLTQDSFCQRNKISSSDFEKANICWDDLMAIGLDHQRLFDARKESAEFFAKVIQGCNKVHSVRWRVKDPQHLMEKIVRKRNPDSNSYNERYTSISVSNYHEIITDLVGVRALHLFKDDYLDIDSYLRDNWSHIEKPIYYHREGDVQDSVSDIFDKKPHPAGYRSIHYIFTSQPLNKILLTEVQVRTIFEEGWSEIDHVVRYPNFSNNQHISNFLQIFNRLSGSADEMGSFAKQLAKELQDRTEMLEKLQREYDETKAENSVNEDKIKSLFSQLKDLSDDNADKSALISELEHAVEKKNRMATLMDNDAFLSTLSRNIPLHLNANIASAAMLGTLSEKQKKVI
ncbi:RelA/SpoT domain-containing protein [Aeromonas allosaccharophila]|uniref:RelA/SpoT domain-containing protein n=1 Tax=Aeromonas allosaccharophila TaxID=656 RepID=A0A7T2PJ71_9GAMM|nr:RelA/SpoT domain-containing protein [Aeromonas allosaccharophila]QPR56709.1 RelA/SpoT domain-containing protein [Aeromonas allosaccharophila]